MLNKILLTPVDKMVEIIEKNSNISIKQITDMLAQPRELVEKWLIILEEYNIVDIHYKGLEGFVTKKKEIEDNISKKNKSEEDSIDIESLKMEFIKKARLRDLKEEDLVKLWPKFVVSYEDEIKRVFYDGAKKKGYKDNLTNVAWTKYRKELMRF